MVSLTTVLISLGAIAIYYIFFKKDNTKKLPPGPTPLPLFGNSLSFRNGISVKVDEWRKEYGDIYSFFMGSNRVTVLSNINDVREAFNNPDLSARPEIESFLLLSDGPHGLLNSSGEEWQDQRRWTLRHLRDFGFGKNYFEPTIMEEVNELLSIFKADEGKPIDVSRKFSLAVLNSLWQILTSKRYKQDDPRLLDIFLQNNKFIEDLGKSPVMFLPKLAKLMPELSGWNRLVKMVWEIKSVIVDSVEEHKKTFPEDGTPRDFMDSYLLEIKATTDPKSSFYKDDGERSLKAVVGDLFGAGAETTSNTLNWTILYLCKNPHVQKKLQEELDSVVGKNRQPSLEDRPKLPYLQATMEEVLRRSSLTPIGAFHVATRDIHFHGYDIPKGSWVVGNFHGIHHDEKHFPNPQAFNPERHLSTVNGKTVFKKPDAGIAFSVGKRACLGETLARDEFYLFFASIFQKFNLELAPESRNVDVQPKLGFISMAKEYSVVMTERMTN